MKDGNYLHSILALLFKCTILFMSPFTRQISRAGLIQIRGCRADAHRASWRKASRFWEVPWEIPGFFGVEMMEDMWKCALTWWSRHKEAWDFLETFSIFTPCMSIGWPITWKIAAKPHEGWEGLQVVPRFNVFSRFFLGIAFDFFRHYHGYTS